MPDMPQPKLGNVTAITLSTPDLEVSSRFYQKLGFNELFRSDFPFPLVQISDGALMMMLRKDPAPYIALTYYVKDINKVVNELEQAGISFIQKPKETDMTQRYIFKSPDGLTISLVSFMDGFV